MESTSVPKADLDSLHILVNEEAHERWKSYCCHLYSAVNMCVKQQLAAHHKEKRT